MTGEQTSIAICSRFFLRRGTLQFILGLALVVSLASCQSVSIDDTFRTESQSLAPDTSSNGEETFGSGSTRITMIVHHTKGGAGNPVGMQYRNGAVLAAKDLGGKAIRLVIVDAKGNAQRVKEIAGNEIAQKSRLVIIPGDSESVSSVSSLAAVGSPPIVALGPTSAAGIYRFTPGATDGLVQGIHFAAVGKKNKVVLVAPKATAKTISAQIKQELDRDISVSGVAAYSESQSGASIVKKYRRLLGSANMVAFASSSAIVTQIASELKKNSKLKELKLVGRQDWTASLIAAPALQGAIIATRDTSGITLIASRYKRAFSQTITASSAYAYDLVALGSGLVRSKGPSGLTRNRIQSLAGFQGTTGLFRFRANGDVQRRYQITRVENGKLNVIQKSVAGF